MKQQMFRVKGPDKKSLLEIRRKIIHILFGTLFCLLIYFDYFSLPFWLGILFLGIIFSFILKKYEIPHLSQFIFSFEREEEIKKFPLKGVITFISGCILSYILFYTPNWQGKFIAISAIITLFIGDSCAAIYGTYFGKFPYRNFGNIWFSQKHLDATIVSIFLNSIFISIFFPFWKAFLASAFTFLIESIDFKIKSPLFDDNLYLPLVSGLILRFL